MADRRPPPGGISKPSSRPGVAPASSTTASIRRNLFQHSLTRRLPSTSTSTSASSSASALDATDPPPQHQHQQRHHQQQVALEQTADPPGDIVIRDKDGEVELGDPPTPVLDAEEMVLDARMEAERERERLAEAVRERQQIGRGDIGEREELLEAVKASLKAKTAALAEDSWMFEKEEAGRHY